MRGCAELHPKSVLRANCVLTASYNDNEPFYVKRLNARNPQHADREVSVAGR
jgi:hypothetical protein